MLKFSSANIESTSYVQSTIMLLAEHCPHLTVIVAERQVEAMATQQPTGRNALSLCRNGPCKCGMIR